MPRQMPCFRSTFASSSLAMTSRPMSWSPVSLMCPHFLRSTSGSTTSASIASAPRVAARHCGARAGRRPRHRRSIYMLDLPVIDTVVFLRRPSRQRLPARSTRTAARRRQVWLTVLDLRHHGAEFGLDLRFRVRSHPRALLRGRARVPEAASRLPIDFRLRDDREGAPRPARTLRLLPRRGTRHGCSLVTFYETP